MHSWRLSLLNNFAVETISNNKTVNEINKYIGSSHIDKLIESTFADIYAKL